MLKRCVIFPAVFLFLFCPVFGQEEAQLLFSDDFGETGSPDSVKWKGVKGEQRPERLVEVTAAGVAERFGVSGGNALRFYKNEVSVAGANLSLTAAERFSRPVPVLTISFDFWENPEVGPGSISLRAGMGNVMNTVRGHEVQFRGGAVSGIDSVYQPGAVSRIRIVMNNSPRPVIYAGGLATVDADSFDVWVDGVRSVESLGWNRGSLPVGAGMNGLQFAVFGNNRAEFLVRDLKVFVGAFGDVPVEREPVEIFLAVDGSDANDGLTPESPVRTLVRAQAILRGRFLNRDARIRIGPGRYVGQKVQWTHVPAERWISFEALEPELPRPVFDGCSESGNCGGGTWFRLDFAGGRLTNLRFRNLRIENYQTAISFNGNRNSETGFNGGNIVENCYFGRIGNVSNPALAASTAVIRFVNSKENRIENNDFVDAINVTSGGLLHAVYVAHLSDRNVIRQNRFVNHSGDPVRVRDFSNGNVITDNVYLRAGAAGYSEWYCDQDGREDCTKPVPECPSWENEFRRNFLISGYNGGRLRTFVFHQPDSTGGCRPVSEGARRLSTSGNLEVSEGGIDFRRHRYFLPEERDREEVAGDFASPAGDGVPNLLKYVFGFDPKRPMRGRFPVVSRAGGGIELGFWRNAGASDVEIGLEVSEDLRSWRKLGEPVPVGEELDDRVWMRLEVPVEGEARFYRIRVERLGET